MTDTKEIAKREDTPMARLKKTGEEIDKIISETLPVSSKIAMGFVDSLVIAKGIADLRQIMLNSPEVKRTVMHMANNRLGFMTDRSPAALAYNRRRGKGPTESYTFEELIDPVIEGLLKGYRISGNEINVLAGNFYAAKNGNYRKVIEWPGITELRYANSPVEYQPGNSQHAKIKCWASWKLNGKAMTIGIDEDDKCLLQIRVNAMMGEDGLVGKAHSKLFKRILERVSGQAAPESSEIDNADYIEAEIADGPKTAIPDNRNIDIIENAAQQPPQTQQIMEQPEPAQQGIKVKVANDGGTDTIHQKDPAPENSAPPEDEKKPEIQKEPEPNDVLPDNMEADLRKKLSIDFRPYGARAQGVAHAIARDNNITFDLLAEKCYGENNGMYKTLVKDIKARDTDLAQKLETENSPIKSKDQEAVQPKKLNGNWDPKKELLMKRYVGEKAASVKAIAKEMNIPTDGRMTAEVHADILKQIEECAQDDVNKIDSTDQSKGEIIITGQGKVDEIEKDFSTGSIKYNGLQISLDIDAGADINAEWGKYVKSRPEVVAKVINQMGMPQVAGAAITCLQIIKQTIKNYDGGKF